MIELLIVIAIIGILMALLFPAVGGAIEAARKAKAKNDVVQLAVAVKAYETEYGKLPTDAISYDDWSEWWFQDNNDEIIRVLRGDNYKGLNPRGIVFLETRPAKGGNAPKDGVGSDNKFYDPWGTPYGMKMDTSYNNRLEYYGKDYAANHRTIVVAISFGKNKVQQDPEKTTDNGEKVDDIVSFQ